MDNNTTISQEERERLNNKISTFMEIYHMLSNQLDDERKAKEAKELKNKVSFFDFFLNFIKRL